MIVMNAMSVFVRTASVTGCRVSVALSGFDRRGRRRRVGQRGGDAEHLLARGGVTVAAGVEQRQRAAGQHDHRDHQDLQGDRLTGQRPRPRPRGARGRGRRTVLRHAS